MMKTVLIIALFFAGFEAVQAATQKKKIKKVKAKTPYERVLLKRKAKKKKKLAKKNVKKKIVRKFAKGGKIDRINSGKKGKLGFDFSNKNRACRYLKPRVVKNKSSKTKKYAQVQCYSKKTGKRLFRKILKS